MKKKILMIANTNGLPGVTEDVYSYCQFFASPVGGNWCRDEFEILLNPAQHELFKKIDEIERANYDYIVTTFSGHGKEWDDGTVLTINGEGEKIAIRHLTGLSRKQLLIFDCCRNFKRMTFDIASIEARATMMSMSRDPIRQAFEDRIQASAPQEIILYACGQGETANDLGDGGLYSSCLLLGTRMTLTYSRSPFISVSTAHHKAVSLMQSDPCIEQHPQIRQTRCPRGQCLPLAINPSLLETCDC